MKKLLLTTAILSASLTVSAENKMSFEAHAKQAMTQMQDAQSKGAGSVVTVGNEVTCDFRIGATRIQDAINTEPDEIRIADDVYDENLSIDDISITIKGGYANCADADNDITNNNIQTISAVLGINSPTLLIQGNTQRNNVNLERIALQDGVGDGFFAPGGGISTFTADLALNLTNVSISLNNSQSFGGGIAIVAGNTDVTLVDVLIISNTADDGGGIYCSGPETSIFVTDTGNGATGIINNAATNGNGGGAYLDTGCVFSTLSGKIPGAFDFRGIQANSATENGGGLYIETGASASVFGSLFCLFGSCIGDNTIPANISDNTADSDGDFSGNGGGVYVTGVNSTLNISNSLIEGNTANSGGGINVADEAELIMRSLYVFGSCWSEGSCNQVIENTTSNTGGSRRGGGLYIQTGGTADVANTEFSNNRANFGTAIYVHAEDGGTRSTLDLEGSLLVFNGNNGADGFFDRNVLRSASSDVKIDFTTIADNNLITTLDAASLDARVTGTIDLYSSIVHDPGQLVYNQGLDGDLDADCLIVNENVSIPSASEDVVDDPEFVDRGAGDFHLNAVTSPALDFCDTLVSSPDFNDSDNDVRGYDDPTATNNLGSYDVGYDETYDNDIIFEDDFDD